MLPCSRYRLLFPTFFAQANPEGLPARIADVDADWLFHCDVLEIEADDTSPRIGARHLHEDFNDIRGSVDDARNRADAAEGADIVTASVVDGTADFIAPVTVYLHKTGGVLSAVA